MSRGKTLLTLSLVVVVVAIGLMAMAIFHSPSTAAATMTAGSRKGGLPAISCDNFAQRALASRGLSEAQAGARKLVDTQHYDAALAEYQKIRTADPGFPGVNLDISLTMLKMGQTAGAKQAVDAQLATSECVEKLPEVALERYCQAELLDVVSCRHELGMLRQGAYFQAALVQMQISHPTAFPAGAVRGAKPSAAGTLARVGTAGGAGAGGAGLVGAGVGGAGVGGSAKSGKAVKAKVQKDPDRDSLASGEGTDAAFGAYSK